MNRIFLLLFLSIFISFNAISQVVTVKRERNKLAIAEVYVFGTANGFSGSTNGAGKLALGELSPNDSLYFQHPGYVKKGIVVQDLKATSNIVFLEDRIIMLPEIVFSATKRVENQREVANQLEKIDASDIVFNNPQTTADVIDQTGQVFVQKSQQGGGSPMIRGFAANRLLIVVDGVRMNNAIFREGNLQNLILVDPNSLESAEVLFGPSSTLYGSDALGGVMNLSSKKTTYSDSFNLYGGAFTRTQTANKEATAHLDLGFSWENFSLFNSITVSDFDDLRSGALRPLNYPDFGKRFTYVRNVNGVDRVDSSKDVNVQRSTGYQQLNALQKIGWKVSKDIEITNSFHFTTSGDIPRYDRLTQLNPDSTFRFGDWHYGPQTWVLNGLNVKLSNKNALYDVLNITPAYQFFNEERVSRRFGRVDESHRIEKVQLITTNVDADKQLNDDQSILYGLEFAFNTVNSTAFQQNINTNTKSPESTRYPDGGSTYNTSAAYISFEQKIDDRYIFSAGTRYSYVSLNSKFEDSTFFSFPYDEINLKTGALNGSVGLVFTPTKAVQV
ncbi:MAG: hemoglobin/transferrin/lactoferrin receptor protein, partial [Sphingobacteriales bacterium]